MLLAYTIIIAIALKITNLKVLALLFILSLFSILPATNRFATFHLAALILLGLFVVPFFYKNAIKYPKPTSLLVFLSFLFLALSHLFFLFMENGIYYVIGTGLHLFSFLMLAIQLIMVYFK